MSDYPVRNRGIKKSNFVAQSTITSGAYLDFVLNGQNYKISFADFLTALGVTGTLTTKGEVTAIPVLNVDGDENQIRNILGGAGITASVSPEGGVKLVHSFINDSTGAEILTDISEDTPKLRSIIGSSGINVAEDGDAIQITLSSTPATTKTVIVNQASDFPAAVAGVITLAADTQYFLTNDISTSDRFVLSDNTVLSAGDPLVCLTYTGSGVMLTANDVTITIKDLCLDCASGTLFSFTCTGASNEVFFQRCKVESCDTFGTVSGFNDFVMSECDIEDVATAGITFGGTSTVANIRDNIIDVNGGTLFDFSTSTFKGITLDNNFVTLAAGTTFLSGATSSANITSGGLGTITNNKIVGTAGTATTGISPEDSLWDAHLNNAIPDSRNSLLATNSGTTVIISAANTPVVVGASWTEQEASRFTATAAGRFTYTGTGAFISLHATVTADIASGIDDCTFYFAKNGTVITDSGVLREIDSGDPGNLSMFWGLELATDDYIEIFCENNDTSVNIIIVQIIARFD